MRNINFAVTQFACSWDTRANIEKAKALVAEAAARDVTPSQLASWMVGREVAAPVRAAAMQVGAAVCELAGVSTLRAAALGV